MSAIFLTEKPLLTIAIPTYNRALYLRELLNVLFDQIVAEPRVELIISDNASQDETSVLAKEYRHRGLSIRYLRNETNIGADANFLQCFEQARGKYVWIFGDDDIIVPDGIAKILMLLDTKEYGLVYINPYMFRHDCAAERTSDKFGRTSELIPNGLRFAQWVGTMIGFISGVIVNKDRYSAVKHQQLSTLIGTSLLQLGYILPVLASDSTHLIIWERLVGARIGNTSGWGICQVFGINFKQILDSMLTNKRDIAKELENNSLRTWFPGVIMEMRRGTLGPLETENLRELLESIYKHSWRYWFYIYPIIVVPQPLAEVWFLIVRSLDRLRRLSLMILPA